MCKQVTLVIYRQRNSLDDNCFFNYFQQKCRTHRMAAWRNARYFRQVLLCQMREIEKFIIRQPPIGRKEDYNSENCWISEGLPSCSRGRRRGEGRGEGEGGREKVRASKVNVGVDGSKSDIKVERRRGHGWSTASLLLLKGNGEKKSTAQYNDNKTHDSNSNVMCLKSTAVARSREDETRNACRNANRNPEWWGYLSQLQFQIKPKSIKCVPRDTEEFKFNQNINSSLYREIPRNLSVSILTSWIKFPHHSRFRFAFRRVFRVSSSREQAVLVNFQGGELPRRWLPYGITWTVS